MIGDTLKRIRAIYGYKSGEMSKKLGIAASILSEIEHNKRKPSLALLQKCADIYGIRLSSLILFHESMEDAEKSGKGSVFIEKMMTCLVENMSKTADDLYKEIEHIEKGE